MDDILWKYSWRNLTMLMLSIPQYDANENENLEINDIDDIKDLLI